MSNFMKNCVKNFIFVHVLLMQNGKLAAQGSAKEILNKENIEHYFNVKTEISESGNRIFISKK